METLIEKASILIEKLLQFILNKILRLSLDEKKINVFVQFIKFGFVGFINTIISYSVYLICSLIGFHYFISNFLSFTVSVLNSFYWNNKYVFVQKETRQRIWFLALLKTYIAYGITGIGLNSVLLYVEVEMLHINKLIAPVFNLLITIPLNFIINKYWAFAENASKICK